MIDRRELLAKARARRLPLAIVEKDYVLGWVLFGLCQLPELVFKGGTALAKVYFPEAWRLSEDLDFVSTPEHWGLVAEHIPEALAEVTEHSRIEVTIKSRHASPHYLQLKLQYTGPLGKNWLKIDVTPEPPIAPVSFLPLSRAYSDYPDFRVRVESLEEILAQKLRALVERKKARDYYDVWRMRELDVDLSAVGRLFPQKLRVKGTAWGGLSAIFPPDIVGVLEGYWERELGRLVHPVPEMDTVLEQLREALGWLEGAHGSAG